MGLEGVVYGVEEEGRLFEEQEGKGVPQEEPPGAVARRARGGRGDKKGPAPNKDALDKELDTFMQER